MERSARDLFLNSSIEVVPSPNVVKLFEKFPDELLAVDKVAVTSSANQTIEDTLLTSVDLVGKNINVVPHIAAQQVWDKKHLETVLDWFDKKDINEIFVVKGDGFGSIGDYKTSGQLLSDIADSGVKFKKIGIAGHPEGVKGMKEENVLRALKSRQDQIYASGAIPNIVTQMCFDSDILASYIVGLRNHGIDSPVSLGVPIPLDKTNLYDIAKRCGVGDSANQLLNEGNLNKNFSPEEFLNNFLERHSVEELGIEGLHMYTFNKITKTALWRRGLV